MTKHTIQIYRRIITPMIERGEIVAIYHQDGHRVSYLVTRDGFQKMLKNNC